MSKTTLLVLTVTLASCGPRRGAAGGPNRPDDINTTPPVDELQDPTHASIAGCVSGDVEAELQIVRDLRDSYHEMIVCGGLAVDFNNSVAGVITAAVIDRARGGKGFTYQGDGVYVAGNGMMVVRATAATDIGGWKAGDPLALDILDPESYLVGIQIDASGVIDLAARGGSVTDILGKAAGTINFSFQAEGPAFALLGLNESEARERHLHIDPRKIEEALGTRIALANRVNVDDEKGKTRVNYHLEGPPRPVKDTRSDKNVSMQLIKIDAARAETNQAIQITEWTMQFHGDLSQGSLDGTIGLDVRGGAFPYHVLFTYPHRPTPDVKLSCR